MSNPKVNPVLRFLHKMRVEQTTTCLSDEQLLNRFAVHHDTLAFEGLMLRHGGMVLVVCRRVLANDQDAEDVFQATFLALAHKARSIHKRRSIGCWLHGVAHRLALKTRADAVKRKAKELGRALGRSEASRLSMTLEEVQPILDEELEALPERLRAPLVLCYLEGKTREESARQLGWSLRTLMRRLEKARELLRGRLTRRGVTMGAALVTTGLLGRSGSAAVPLTLVESTMKAAKTISEGGAATLVVSTRVAALTQGVLSMMLVSKLKIASVVVVAILACVGTAFHSLRVNATDQELPGNAGHTAPQKVATKGTALNAQEAKAQQEEKFGPKKTFENAQGYSWLQRPSKLDAHWDPESIQGLHFVGGSLTITQIKNGSLLFIFTGAEPTMKPGASYRPVVFDNEGKRYLPYGSGGGSSPNGSLSLFTHNFVMDVRELPVTKLAYVGIEAKTNRATSFEDFAQFSFGGGGQSATGVRDKAGFTVIPLEASNGSTKLCVSLAIKEEQTRPPDFRVIAVDADNHRHESPKSNMVSAGGNGTTIITMVSEFNLDSDAIKRLVVQRRSQK